MISWMQRVMQKHYKWLFSILLVIIIVAFVFTIGNTGMSAGGAGRKSQSIDFYGFNLASNKDVEYLTSTANISATLNRRPLYTPAMREDAVYKRAVLIYLADMYRIPYPNQQALDEFRRSLPHFQGPDGEFSPAKYTEFVDLVKANPNISEKMVMDVFQEDYRLEQVRKILAGPGYTLPTEAIMIAQQAGTTWSVDVAQLDYTAFQPEIEVTEEEIADYYEANKFRYDIPERVRTAYTVFQASAYVDEVTEPADQELKTFYNMNQGKFSDAESFEDAKAEVVEAYKLNQALSIAVQKANELQLTLYREKIEYGTDAFAEQLADYGVELTEIPEYSRNALPNHAVLPRKTLLSVFELGTRYFTEPAEIDNGVAVVFLAETIPTETPPLEAVRDAVVKDLKEQRRKELFEEKGETLAATLESELELATEPFAILAAKQGLEVTPLTDFTMREPPANAPMAMFEELRGMEQHELSDMVIDDNTGYFFYVRTKDVPAYTTEDDVVTQQMVSLKFISAERARQAVLDELVSYGIASSESSETN